MKTHWKKLTNPNYLGSYDFAPNEERTLKVTKVATEMVQSLDGDKVSCIVAQLENSKPIILNKTNCKTITKIAGSAMIEDWSGLRITLVVRKVRAFGETVEALRISERKPELPELTPASEKWEAARLAVVAGKVTIAQIKQSYKLSKQHENELK